MAYRMTVEILLSSVELALIKEYDINIPRVVVQAVTEELANRNALKANLGGISTRDLQVQLAHARAELETLRLKSAQMIPVHLRRK